MITDLLLVDNDLAFDHGVLTVTGDNAILQDAIENITIAYGEILIDNERGNKLYAKRMKLTNINMKSVEEDCVDAILYDNRISSVTVKATRNNIMSCTIQFDIMTVSGSIINGNTSINII